MKSLIRKLSYNDPFCKITAALTQKYGSFFRNYVWFFLFILQFIDSSFRWIESDSPFLQQPIPMFWRTYILILLFGIYCLCGYTRKELALISLILFLLGIPALQSRSIPLILLTVFIFSARGISFRKICKVSCLCFCICLISVIFLCFCGITIDDVVIRTEIVGQGTIRHSLGFNNPNGFAVFLTMAMVTFMLWKHNSIGMISYAVCFLITILGFALSNSKVNLCLDLLIIIGMALIPQIRRRHLTDIYLKALFIFIPCITVGWIFLSMIYDPAHKLLYFINVLTSDRLNLSHMAFETFGADLFGKIIIFSFPVDSLYAKLPVRYGWPAFICLFFLIICTSIRLRRRQIPEIMVMLTAYMLYCTMETPISMVGLNIVLFALTSDLSDEACDQQNKNRITLHTRHRSEADQSVGKDF